METCSRDQGNVDKNNDGFAAITAQRWLQTKTSGADQKGRGLKLGSMFFGYHGKVEVDSKKSH